MAAERDEILWLNERVLVSIAELSECTGVTQAQLRELVEYGALAPADPQAGEWTFSADWVVSVRAAARVCHDLELETPALALALSYLERIHRLEEEVRRLSAQLGEPRR
jgi:chaperone modulatory protein CbpM